MKIIKLPEFAERLRQRLDDNRQEVVWFLGAGCSISSGIKAAGGLVDDWLDELHRMRAADQDRNTWARSAFRSFDPKKPALHYAEVFEERHPNAADRQQAIERICARGEAAYGYATLAQIITDDRIGGRCNTVLTTNFDDLLVEAIYMYGALRVRPQIITHEAVAHYARLSQTRPTIIKVHGDAHLDPKNLRHETATLDDTVAAHLHAFIKNATLVFLGYGGNDQSIVRFLKDCPWPPLPQPIYWVGTDTPSPDMAEWLESHEAVKVDHRDFDVAMHMLRLTLDIPHPDEARWTRAKDRYLEALSSYGAEKKSERDPATRKALREASEKSTSSGPRSAWGYAAAAIAAHDDPERAIQIYQEGISRYDDDPTLLGNYALFLIEFIKDVDGADVAYKRALDADPNHANNLCNYANLLWHSRKAMDRAEALYERAISADSSHANALGNYAVFLSQVRNDADAAEALYKRAITADPHHANNLGNYATFLYNTRDDTAGAEDLYELALDADPNHAATLRKYAYFVWRTREDLDAAKVLYERAIESDPSNPDSLSSYAHFLAVGRKDEEAAEVFLQRAMSISPEDADTLVNYAVFLTHSRMDFERAEPLYKKALDSDPENANYLGNYSQLLLAKGEENGLKILDRALNKVQDEPALARGSLGVELAVYAYAHDTRQPLGQRLKALKAHVLAGARSASWDFSANVERAEKDDHPQVDLLKAVVEVVAHGAPVEALDAFAEWKKA